MTDEKTPLGLKKIHHVEFYIGWWEIAHNLRGEKRCY
jgi:TRAP-type mannitol/chloroaromatic compound transport system substrate-binding protein